MKNNKGITLIALIVTIIVLIILAGVAIAMLSGDNGVLKNAEAARYDTSISAFDERVKLAQMTVKTTITSNMIQVASGGTGYAATSTDNYGKLVAAVTKELAATEIAANGNINLEGYTVYNNLASYRNPNADPPVMSGTGYIVVAFTDNAFRSSLPILGSEDATKKNLKETYDTNDSRIFKSGNSEIYVDKYDPDTAVLVYVIKVTNYSSELSKAVLTSTTNLKADTASFEAFAGNGIDGDEHKDPSKTYDAAFRD